MNWNYFGFHLVAEGILVFLVLVAMSIFQDYMFGPTADFFTARVRLFAKSRRWTHTFSSHAVSPSLRPYWSLDSVFLWWTLTLGSTFLLHLPSMWKRRVQLRRPREPLDRQWYRPLRKPFWNPPDIVFPLMWIPAKLLRGIGTSLMWERVARAAYSPAVLLALSSVVLADLWNQIFFIQHDVGGGLFVIVVLLTVEVMYSVQLAALLPGSERFTLPGLIACAFGTTLNFSIWTLNRRPRQTKAWPVS